MKNEMISQVLKKYRKSNNLKVHDVSVLLAEKSVFVADKTIYGWESGQTQPDADTLLLLCDIYNIDNILETFGYKKDFVINLTRHEEKLIASFRQHPELQEAVNKLLDLND